MCGSLYGSIGQDDHLAIDAGVSDRFYNQRVARLPGVVDEGRTSCIANGWSPVAKFRDTNPIAKAMTIKNNVRTEILFLAFGLSHQTESFSSWEELTNVWVQRAGANDLPLSNRQFRPLRCNPWLSENDISRTVPQQGRVVVRGWLKEIPCLNRLILDSRRALRENAFPFPDLRSRSTPPVG